MKRFTIIAVTFTALAVAGCGGVQQDIQSSGEEMLAPASVLEQDLPGCDALEASQEHHVRWRLLVHPLDQQLYVAEVDGRPVCVDTRSGAVQLLHSWGAPDLSKWAVQNQRITRTVGTNDDDPVPIVGPFGGTTTKTEEPSEGEETSKVGGIAELSSQFSDDPVPIRGMNPMVKEIEQQSK